MDVLAKLKETLGSVLPIVAVVLILNFTIAPLGELLFPFLVGSVLLIAGLTVFLAGADIGMVPVGRKLGSSLTQRKSVFLMLSIGLLIGFAVTLAEPDVTVLANQVHSMNASVNPRFLVFLISAGLGVFVDIGLLRAYGNAKLRNVLLISYMAVFFAVAFSGQKMASISFDASGATTGPLAVPFLLSLGLGVSSSKKNGQDDSFGLTGIASVGPVLAVSLMSVFSKSVSSGAEEAAVGISTSVSLGECFVQQLKNTAFGFGPLALIIVIMQFALFRFPKIKFRKIVLGMVYSFFGIVVFLSGVEYGFSAVGRHLGRVISSEYSPWVCVITALVFGAIVVCAEPAVWVLTEQIETVSAGRIKKSLVMIALCSGVSIAVALAVVRIFFSINYLYFVFIGVGSALILSFFTPPLFTGIAFDSGGVASGPMSTSFLLSFAMGVSGSAEMGFGLVGLIAISPLISIQILGIIFSVSERRNRKGGHNDLS